MSESILTTIKKMLGIEDNYNVFDTDIIAHINTVFITLNQLGVGPLEGFSISDNSKTWHDYIQGRKNIESIKSYIYLRVKILFDPPSSSFVLESMKREIAEIEWRLNVEVDTQYPQDNNDDSAISFDEIDDMFNK